MEDYNTAVLSSQSPQHSCSDSQKEDEQFELILNDNTKAYQCLQPDCGKIFRFKSEMKRHIVVHLKQRPYTCSFPECNKTFKRSDALNNHSKVHTLQISYTCDLPGCNAEYSTKSALSYHLLRHEGKKTFRCTVPGCSREFLTQAQLKQHEGANTYHRRIRNSTLTNQHSPEQDLVQDTDIGMFCGIESAADYDYNHSSNGSASRDPTTDCESSFSGELQSHFLDTTPTDLNPLKRFCNGSFDDTKNVKSQKQLFAISPDSGIINLMNDIFSDDKDLKERLSSYLGQMCSRIEEQTSISSNIDVDSFFKSSEDEPECENERDWS